MRVTCSYHDGKIQPLQVQFRNYKHADFEPTESESMVASCQTVSTTMSSNWSMHCDIKVPFSSSWIELFPRANLPNQLAWCKGKEQSLKINKNNLRCRFMSQRGMDKLKVLWRTTMVQVSWQITCTICCQSSQVMAPIRKWKISGQNHIIDCLDGKKKEKSKRMSDIPTASS